jgi:hypothetical protein
MGGYSAAGIATHTTALAYGTDFASCNLGSTAVPTALVDAAATIVNGRLLLSLGGSALAAAVSNGAWGIVDVGGAIRLQPGAWAGLFTFTAITGTAAFWWSEEPR